MAFPSVTPNHIEDIPHSRTSTGFVHEVSFAEDGTGKGRLKDTALKSAWRLTYSKLSTANKATMIAYRAAQYVGYSTDT